MYELKKYGIIPVSPSVLSEALADYHSVKDKISSLERSGDLIRLRNGLYVVSNKITEQNFSLELIANQLYGPSYVSFEAALSYYGLIPERVYLVKSATPKRAKSYQTPLGVFEYIRVPQHYYPIGVRSVLVNNTYAFMMASPEKAFCDQIISTAGLRIQSLTAMHRYIEDDMRMDTGLMQSWDLSIIEACIEYGPKKNDLLFLLKYLKNE